MMASGETEKTPVDEEEKQDDEKFVKPDSTTTAEIEKIEEDKLRAKYPAMRGPGPVTGHNALLKKRLAKGQKFFDSGDYNMARAKGNNKQPPIVGGKLLLAGSTAGGAIPTPETVPARKSSLVPPTSGTFTNPLHPGLSSGLSPE